MAKLLTLARPYAQALFSYADEHAQIPLWLQVSQVLSLLAEHPSFLQLVQNPQISDDQQLDLIKSILVDCVDGLDQVDALLNQYLRLLIAERRLNLMADINVLFEQKIAAKESTRPVEVQSAFSLDSAQQQRLNLALEQYFQSKVDVKYSEDPHAIGGVKVKSHSLVIDRSVRDQLNKLREQFRDSIRG